MIYFFAKQLVSTLIDYSTIQVPCNLLYVSVRLILLSTPANEENLRGSGRATSAPLGNAAVKQKPMAMGFKFQLPTTRPAAAGRSARLVGIGLGLGLTGCPAALRLSIVAVVSISTSMAWIRYRWKVSCRSGQVIR